MFSSVWQQTHQETCPQIIPLGLLDLERLVKAVSGVWDILVVLRRRFGLGCRLLIGWLLVVWLRVWCRRVIWLLIVPMLLLITIVWLRRLTLRDTLVIVARSLSTHICVKLREGENPNGEKKEKKKKGEARNLPHLTLVTTRTKQPSGNLDRT